MQQRAVTVLGAGLTGASVALELAGRGVPVTLVERDAQPFGRASLRNEGKIHLGLIYANDASLATARLQLQGALHFSGLLRRWLGPAADRLRASTPFHYLVAKDSLLHPDRLESHYAEVERLYTEMRERTPELDYLGGTPKRLYARVEPSSLEPFVRGEHFAAAFQTAELAIDTAELSAMFRSAIAGHSLIDFRPQHLVQSVTPAGEHYRVDCDTPAGPRAIESRQVVNCLWEERLRIDRSAGMALRAGWVHRLKYRVIARLPEALRRGPSVTMVLGPYGDVVVRDDGTAYLSWYPLGMRGWSHDIAPPLQWDAPCRGDVPAAQAESVARDLLSAIDSWYPGTAQSEVLIVDAGAIVGVGSSDVDDPKSGLHDRTRVGVNSLAGYHSVDPGKLTTAPLFGKLAADRVIEAV